MKYLFLILIALIFSCDKQPVTECYVCTVRTTWYYVGSTITAEKDYLYCDVDQEWIVNYIRINNYTDTTSNPMMTQYTTCKKTE